jgi:hypothetical protein
MKLPAARFSSPPLAGDGLGVFTFGEIRRPATPGQGREGDTPCVAAFLGLGARPGAVLRPSPASGARV